MAKTRSAAPPKKVRRPSPLMLRLDEESKAYLVEAAKLRDITSRLSASSAVLVVRW